MQELVKAGEWVEIEFTIIPAISRSSKLPVDTQKVDFKTRIKGYLIDDAQIGQEVTIQSILNRELRGRLIAANPPFPATFGSPVRELMEVGKEIEALLAGIEESKQ